MAKQTSVKVNFIMNFILTISNFIFPLVTFPYVSRILMAEGIGTVSFATSIISYFSMIGMLGIPTYGIRACAKVRDDKDKLHQTVLELMLLNAIVMAFSIVALLIAVLTVDKLSQERLLYLVMSATLIFNVLGVDWLYKALERYSYITIRSIVFKLLSLILLFLMVKDSTDYVFYGAISVFASVGSNLLNFINMRKMVEFKLPEPINLAQHLKPTLTFFTLSVSTTVYLNLDTTMLGFMRGDVEVGYYSAATKIKTILVSVVTSLGAVLLPRLSYYYENKKTKEFERLTKKALNFVLVISLPMLVYFIIFAKQCILFLSGQDFLPAIVSMQLIIPTVLFIGLSNLSGIQILVPMNLEKKVVISTICGAIVDLVLNIFFIPNFGAAGASLATTIAEFVVTAVQFYYLRDLILPMLGKIRFDKIGLGLIVATAVTIFGVNHLTLPLFFTLALSASLFFGIYALTLFLVKEEFVVSIAGTLLSRFS